MAPDYKYDVAFSLLDRDESLAREILALLPTLSTFLYSERQAQTEIVGTDGVETFADVFGRDARIVVVLYREAWGTTKWTRVEENAVRTRVLNEGAEFVTLILLDKGKPTPRWLAPTRIWLDLERLGAQGAASVIHERVRQAGSVVREETAEENGSRLARELAAEGERVGFLKSEKGVRAADDAASMLFDTLQGLASPGGFAVERLPQVLQMYRDGFSVVVGWSRSYVNTLDDSALYVVEWRGRPHIGGNRYANFDEPHELDQHEFRFDMLTAGDIGWREKRGARMYSTSKLADRCVQLLLDRVRGSKLDRC